MVVTRHTKSSSEEATSSEEITGDTYRLRYNSTKNRFEAKRLIAEKWYTEWAKPAYNLEENFSGYYISGLALIGQNTFFSGTIGGGSAAIIQEPTGGIRYSTGAGGDSSIYLGSGVVALQNFYKPNKEIFATFEQKIPDAPSLLYTDCFLGFFLDNDNYLGWNYIADAAVDQWFLITRADGTETITKVGESPGIDPITLRLSITESLVRGWYNDEIIIEHTTNIPDETMALYCNFSNRVAAVKNADLLRIQILNDL